MVGEIDDSEQIVEKSPYSTLYTNWKINTVQYVMIGRLHQNLFSQSILIGSEWLYTTAADCLMICLEWRELLPNNSSHLSQRWHWTIS